VCVLYAFLSGCTDWDEIWYRNILDHLPLGTIYANLKRVNSNPGWCSYGDYETYVCKWLLLVLIIITFKTNNNNYY